MSVPQVYSLLRIGILAVNLITFAAFGWDKYCARHGRRRIPESVLLALAAIGGSSGALLGMALFNHKTRKLRFNITVPVLLVIHAALLFVLTMGL